MKQHKRCRLHRHRDIPATALESSVGTSSSENCNLCNQANRQKNWWQNFAIIIQGSLCILLGCSLIIANVSLCKIGTRSHGLEPLYRYLRSGMLSNICWGLTLSKLNVFPNDYKLFASTEDINSPNTLPSVSCSSSKVKLSSSLNGCPTGSG